MKTNQFNRESGFTLLELLLVIGVAALLLIGGIATYRLVSDGNKATEATRMLLTIRQEAAVMAQQQGSYAGVGFDSLGVTPPDASSPLIAAGVLRSGQRNPFNGNILIAPSAAPSLNLIVTFNNVSQPSCLKLAQAINNPNEVVSIVITGTAATTFTSAGAQIPVPIASAVAACNAPTNIMTWTFP